MFYCYGNNTAPTYIFLTVGVYAGVSKDRGCDVRQSRSSRLETR